MSASNTYLLSINSPKTTAVDPWLPRIQNNDEYLELGLTFALAAFADDDASASKSTYAKPFGDVGAVRLADALQYNTTLQSLDLSGNNIGLRGGVALAKAFYRCDCEESDEYKSRTALLSLNMSHNNIGDQGAHAFAQALQYNTSLKHLDLSCNGLSIEGVTALINSLSVNQNLRTLNLSGNLKQINSQHMSELMQNIGSVLHRNQLEVLEIHSEYNDKSTYDSCLGGATDYDVCTLLLCCVYEVSNYETAEALRSLSERNLSEGYKVQSHRLRKLTLPSSEDLAANDTTSSVKTRLLRVLQFNAFYHPILMLHDLPNSRSNKYFDSKLPSHLQRDVYSGALIGLLPSPALNDQAKRRKSTGIGLKGMPRVITFAGRNCKLDTMWNVLRYRPDVFRYAGKSFRNKGGVKMDCGGCLIL